MPALHVVWAQGRCGRCARTCQLAGYRAALADCSHQMVHGVLQYTACAEVLFEGERVSTRHA